MLDPDGSIGNILNGGSVDILSFVVLVFCIAMSAFFSASETSLLTVGKIRAKRLFDDGVKHAKALTTLLENPDKMLGTVLICNNLVNILASAISTSLAIRLFSGRVGIAVGIATGLVTLLILIFGEITPKSLAVRNAEKISLFVARPLLFLITLLTPLVFVLNKIASFLIALLGGNPKASAPTYTEQELKTMVNVSHEEGVLNVDEKEMIHNVFEFGDGDVREIMTPRIHVVSIELDADYETVRAIYRENEYTRMPVTKPGADAIVGFFNIKDVVFSGVRPEEFHVSDYMRPPHFVYEFNNIAKVFSEMRRDRIAMYGVLDEYGVMVGIITTEDFIEEIVGDINDEYDDETENTAKEVGDNEYVVDGTMAIDAFNDFVGVSIESDDFDSIGGFVLGILEDFPTVGDRVAFENVEFIIESVKENRIEALRVKLNESDAAAPEDAGDDGDTGNGTRIDASNSVKSGDKNGRRGSADSETNGEGESADDKTYLQDERDMRDQAVI